MGERIWVHARLPGSRNAPGLMLVSGVLESAPEVVQNLGGDGEHFFFRVGADGSLAGFFLDPNRFRGASWDDSHDPPWLVIQLVHGAEIVVQGNPDEAP
jgi:hypothetical protein